MITKLLNEVNENIKTLNNLVQDKEYFEKLDERIEKVNNYVQEQKREIERLNNIIKELEKYIKESCWKDDWGVESIYVKTLLNKLQELKGEDKK